MYIDHINGHDHGHDHSEHDHGHDHCELDHGHDHGHDHGEHDHYAALSNLETGGHNHATNSPLHSPKPESSTDAMKRIMNGGNEGNVKHAVDNNYRAAVIHVFADAIVSVLVLLALIIEYKQQTVHFLDPLVGMIGSFVIISWGYVLVYDTSSNLLDMNPDMKMTQHIKNTLEKDGSAVTDMHVWRLGPGHLGAVISVMVPKNAMPKLSNSNCSRGNDHNDHDHDHDHNDHDHDHDHNDHDHDHDHHSSSVLMPYSIEYYKSKLSRYRSLSHVTIEIQSYVYTSDTSQNPLHMK